jgi:hypothetical protein
MGLAFDEWDLDYYTKLFKDMGRDPTNVELFDIAQVRVCGGGGAQLRDSLWGRGRWRGQG